MSSDRVHDIINGRVSDYDLDLPEGAVPILEDSKLPFGAERVPQIIGVADMAWRQPGTDPSELNQDKDVLPPTPPPADLFGRKDDGDSGGPIVSQISNLLSRFRTDVDDKFEEQAGLIREMIDNRRQYRIEMEKLRQEELARQRAWEEEQRDQWSIQNNFIADAVVQIWWWMKLVGWGVGITTVIAIVAMFFGQPWGSALLWGLGAGIMTIVGMVGHGFANIMNIVTGQKGSSKEDKTVEELEAMIKDLKSKSQ